MSRTTQKFMVEIVTEDKIVDDNEINEMAQNINDAIVNHVIGDGIVPENSETFVKIVYVKGWYSDTQTVGHTF